MNRITLFYIVLIAVGSIGCATAPKLAPELQKSFDEPLVCRGVDECKLMWDRAVYFVSTNSDYKMQLQSDVLIQTFGPSEYSPSLAFKVTKEPAGDGQYRIWVYANCANILGCSPPWQLGVARAKLYIGSGVR